MQGGVSLRETPPEFLGFGVRQKEKCCGAPHIVSERVCVHQVKVSCASGGAVQYGRLQTKIVFVKRAPALKNVLIIVDTFYTPLQSQRKGPGITERAARNEVKRDPPEWALSKIDLRQVLQVDAKLLALFVEMAALKAKSLCGLGHVAAVAVELGQDLGALKGEHTLG